MESTTIAEKLLAARTALGKTQAEVAFEVGCDKNTYIAYEKGVRPPSSKNVPALSLALGIPQAELLPNSARKARSRVEREADTFTAQEVDAYLASAIGRTALPETQAKLRDPGQLAFKALGLHRPSQDQIHSLRKLLEGKPPIDAGPGPAIPPGARHVRRRPRR